MNQHLEAQLKYFQIQVIRTILHQNSRFLLSLKEQLYEHLRMMHVLISICLKHLLILELANKDSHLHLQEMFMCLDVLAIRKLQHPMKINIHFLKLLLYELYHRTLLLLLNSSNLISFQVLVNMDNHLHLLACIEYLDVQVDRIHPLPMNIIYLLMSRQLYEHLHMQFE